MIIVLSHGVMQRRRNAFQMHRQQRRQARLRPRNLSQHQRRRSQMHNADRRFLTAFPIRPPPWGVVLRRVTQPGIKPVQRTAAFTSVAGGQNLLGTGKHPIVAGRLPNPLDVADTRIEIRDPPPGPIRVGDGNAGNKAACPFRRRFHVGAVVDTQTERLAPLIPSPAGGKLQAKPVRGAEERPGHRRRWPTHRAVEFELQAKAVGQHPGNIERPQRPGSAQLEPEQTAAIHSTLRIH